MRAAKLVRCAAFVVTALLLLGCAARLSERDSRVSRLGESNPALAGGRKDSAETTARVDAFVIADESLRAQVWIFVATLDARARWLHAVAAHTTSRARRARDVAPPRPQATSTSGTCPAIPAWISQRESRCTYTARNPSGAGGAYQLMPSTANALAPRIGRADLVGVNPSDWPADAQDAAAALLWNNGAGACNWTPSTYCG